MHRANKYKIKIQQVKMYYTNRHICELNLLGGYPQKLILCD